MSEIDISFESRLRDALAGARVWVSGGRGFIGGRMVELLTAAGVPSGPIQTIEM